MSVCRCRPSQAQTSNESSLDKLPRRKHILRSMSPDPFIIWMALPSSLTQVSDTYILPIIRSLFLGQNSEVEICISCLVVLNEDPGLLAPQSPWPTNLTRDLNSLGVVTQHGSSTTMATGKNKGLKPNFSRCSTVGFHRVPAEAGMCSITLRRGKIPPWIKAMKRKRDSGTAIRRVLFPLLPGWPNVIVSGAIQCEVSWRPMQSWRGPLSKCP